MNNALDSLKSNAEQSLDDRLSIRPVLRARMHALVDVIEAAGGDCVTAAQAEARMVEEIRKIGAEALTAWSQRADDHAQSQMSRQKAERDGKKNSTGIRSLEKSS